MSFTHTLACFFCLLYDNLNCWMFLNAKVHDFIHTCIIGHYNPSVRVINLVSHTTYVVCVNFIYKWRDLQFKVDSELQIFWETCNDNFIYTQSSCKKSAERKSIKKYFLYFFYVWPRARTPAIRLISQHTTY